MALGTPRSAASMNDVSRPAGGLSVLTLRVDVLDDDPDWPVLAIVVDGENPFDLVAKDWRGFDPGQILGEGSPLTPTDGGRRVAVTTCSCGIAGCGVIAPIIVGSPDGRRVSWVDFRDFTGIFNGPIADSRDEEGQPWRLPDLHFDREQYLAEVERATHDWSWETDRRATARLLGKQLREFSPTLPSDRTFRWAAPPRGADGVEVLFERPHDGSSRFEDSQALLRLTSTRVDPAEAAADMLAQFLAVPPEERAGFFRYERPEFGDSGATTSR
jgi:hypothetical protein